MVDVMVNSLSRGRGADRNKSLLSCDVLVLNYEWIGWEFVCVTSVVMEWVVGAGGEGVWMIDCRGKIDFKLRI